MGVTGYERNLPHLDESMVLCDDHLELSFRAGRFSRDGFPGTPLLRFRLLAS